VLQWHDRPHGTVGCCFGDRHRQRERRARITGLAAAFNLAEETGGDAFAAGCIEQL
jgi:hypothetical protein